jgi:alkenylglycerophosphocholine/alkenylglycerophosphoethanolamine hydrolase
MTLLSKVVYTVFFCFAVLFITTLNLCPYPFDYIIKTIPVLSLAVLAFAGIPGRKGKLIGVGLLFSGAGDIILEIDGTGLFVYGLGAFLIAHLFYIAAFIRQPEISRSRLPVPLAICVYGVIMGVVLFPHLGDMLIPVAVYLLIVLGMGISAALGTTNHSLVVAGAALFILSDSFIAINRFLVPVPLSGLLIMTTYYMAQFLITFGSSK